MRTRSLLGLLALLASAPLTPPLAAQSRSIAVAPDSITLHPGDTARLTPTVRAGGGAALGAAAVTWSSRDTAIVAVRAGKLTARAKLGCTTILAQHSTYVRAEVAACVVAAPVVTPPPAPAPTPAACADWSSTWSHGTGTAATAKLDGGAWDMSGGELVDIVDPASVGFAAVKPGYAGNVARVRFRGGAGYGQLQRTDVVPASTRHWVRFYFRNDAGRRNDHGTAYNALRAGTTNTFQIAPFLREGGASGTDAWRAGVIQRFEYPLGRMRSPALRSGVWYRVEWEIEYHPADGTRYRQWPRIYDAAGTLLYDADDFTNAGETRTVTSLLALYDTAGVNRFAPLGVLNGEDAVPEAARRFGIGNEGPNVAHDPATPEFFYFADVRVSCRGWIGR